MPRPRLDHVRKAQIVSAAAEVLSDRGYANARVVDIAKAAGTSPARSSTGSTASRACLPRR
jgi:AcrR family transcriptional regulator